MTIWQNDNLTKCPHLFNIGSDELDALVLQPRNVEQPGRPKEVDHVPGLQKFRQENSALALQIRQQEHLRSLHRLVHIVDRQLGVKLSPLSSIEQHVLGTNAGKLLY